MIRAKDENGNDLEFSIYGKYDDDIQIDEIYYINSEDEVSETTIDYVMDRYSNDIYEEWLMNQVDAAEAWHRHCVPHRYAGRRVYHG